MAGAKDQTRAARVCVRLFLADASKGTHLLQHHATPMSLFHWYRRTGIMTGNVEASCSATACQQVWFGHGSFRTSNIFTLHSCLPFKAYKAVSSGPARNKAILVLCCWKEDVFDSKQHQTTNQVESNICRQISCSYKLTPLCFPFPEEVKLEPNCQCNILTFRNLQKFASRSWKSQVHIEENCV